MKVENSTVCVFFFFDKLWWKINFTGHHTTATGVVVVSRRLQKSFILYLCYECVTVSHATDREMWRKLISTRLWNVFASSLNNDGPCPCYMMPCQLIEVNNLFIWNDMKSLVAEKCKVRWVDGIWNESRKKEKKKLNGMFEMKHDKRTSSHRNFIWNNEDKNWHCRKRNINNHHHQNKAVYHKRSQVLYILSLLFYSCVCACALCSFVCCHPLRKTERMIGLWSVFLE